MLAPVQFQQCCVAKAASAGRRVLFVDPRSTSQRCSGGGAIVKKALDERWPSCACGTELDRDHHAASNLLLAHEAAHRLTGLEQPRA